MAVTNGGELREWRRSRGWDVPELARRLRRAADESIAAHDGLVRMIRAWERGDHRPSERYELLYRRLGLPSGNENGAEPQPTPTRRQEGTEPVRRRTFVELTGISLAGAILPGAVGASGRIVTHTLMSSGHLAAAVTTAQNHAVRLDCEPELKTPESLSVYGSVLLRGALAAAQHDDRTTAHEMLTEAADTARRLGSDANLCGTAFGPVNTQMHQVNVAVTVGDAGTAIDLARHIDLRAVTVTERKASLLIDVARAFFQWGKYEQAHAALRAAEDTAPQEVAARPSVATLARDLATLAPASIRRDAEQFASRIGAPR